MHKAIVILFTLYTFGNCWSKEEVKIVNEILDQDLKKENLKKELLEIEKSITNKKEALSQKILGNDVKIPSVDHCIDMYGSEQCDILVNKQKMSCNSNRLNDMCEKTCGFCGKSINEVGDCRLHLFGCCSDGTTTKEDKEGSNCPVCKDNENELCKGYESDCHEDSFAGEWMRLNCKRTCGLCDQHNRKPSCDDDPEQAVFCGEWKDEGLCTELPELMDQHCRKTCGKC